MPAYRIHESHGLTFILKVIEILWEEGIFLQEKT